MFFLHYVCFVYCCDFFPAIFYRPFKSESSHSVRIWFCHYFHALYNAIYALEMFFLILTLKKKLTTTSCSSMAYSPSVFWRMITISISFCLAGTPGYVLQCKTFTYKSNSFLIATFLDTMLASSLFVSILPNAFYLNDKHYYEWRHFKVHNMARLRFPQFNVIMEEN